MSNLNYHNLQPLVEGLVPAAHSSLQESLEAPLASSTSPLYKIASQSQQKLQPCSSPQLPTENYVQPHHHFSPAGSSSDADTSSGDGSNDLEGNSDDSDNDCSGDAEDDADSDDEKVLMDAQSRTDAAVHHASPAMHRPSGTSQTCSTTIRENCSTQYEPPVHVPPHIRAESIVEKSSPPSNQTLDYERHYHQSLRISGKRPAKEMALSCVNPNDLSPPKKIHPLLKTEPEHLVHSIDSRPRQALVSSSSPDETNHQLPLSPTTSVSLVCPSTPSNNVLLSNVNSASKISKRRKVRNTISSDGTKSNIPKNRGGRTTSTPQLPHSAVHPNKELGLTQELIGTEEMMNNPFRLSLTAAFGSEVLPLRSVISQLCTRATRRLRDLDSLRHLTDVSFCPGTTSALDGPSSREQNDSKNGSMLREGSTASFSAAQLSDHSVQASNRTVAQLQLTRLAEISEREIRLAVLQQHCYRILRNLNLCFPLWASRQGSYLWHSAFLLGSTSLRDLAPYCIVFEEVWDDVLMRYVETFRQTMEQNNGVESTENSQGNNKHSPSIDIQKPKELSGGFLSALMFQGDSVTYVSCLIQLDNIRHRVDSDFEPMTDFQEVLATFTASQALHTQHQSPSKFLLAPFSKFRSAADINAGMGRGGKRKAALAALLGGTPKAHSTAPSHCGRGRSKKTSVRSGTAAFIQNSMDTDRTNVARLTSVNEAPVASESTQGQQPPKIAFGTTNSIKDHHHLKEEEESKEQAGSASSQSPLHPETLLQQKKDGHPFQLPMVLSPHHPEHSHSNEDDDDDEDEEWDGSSDNENSSYESVPSTAVAGSVTAGINSTHSGHYQQELMGAESIIGKSASQMSSENHCSPSPPPARRLSSPVSTPPIRHPVSEVKTISGSSHRFGPTPPSSMTGSSLTPISYVPPNDSAALYSAVSPATALAVAALAVPPKIQTATQSAPHLVATTNLRPSSQMQGTLSLPSQHSRLNSHSTANSSSTSPINSLSPDAFELPRDSESFRSQVKGVYYDDTSNRWCASWHERKTGKKRSRYFAVKKFGFAQVRYRHKHTILPQGSWFSLTEQHSY